MSASARQIAHVKRKYPDAKWRGHSKPLPEGIEPPEVPPEIEVAIEAALKHFRMI